MSFENASQLPSRKTSHSSLVPFKSTVGWLYVARAKLSIRKPKLLTRILGSLVSAAASEEQKGSHWNFFLQKRSYMQMAGSRIQQLFLWRKQMGRGRGKRRIEIQMMMKFSCQTCYHWNRGQAVVFRLAFIV